MIGSKAFVSVLLAGTMLASAALSETLTAVPGDTIEVEYGYGSSYGGGVDSEQNGGTQGSYNEDFASTFQGSGGSGGSSGGGCDNMLAQAASAAAAGIGAIISITGRATAPLQIAQQLQLVAQTICDTEQTRIADDQLGELRRATARVDGNAAVGIRRIERGARAAIGAVDRGLYGTDAAGIMRERYQEGMPEGWTFDTAAQHTEALRRQTDLATQEAAATAALSARSMNDVLSASDNAVALSQDAEGQTSAIQAQTQLIRAQTGAMTAQNATYTAMATAQLRMAQEQRAAEIYADQKIQRLYGPSDAVAGIDGGTPRRPLFN